MPNVTRALGRDNPRLDVEHTCHILWHGFRLPQDPSNRRCAKVQTGSRQHLGDPDLPHPRAQGSSSTRFSHESIVSSVTAKTSAI
jgi:hypothetical protein